MGDALGWLLIGLAAKEFGVPLLKKVGEGAKRLWDNITPYQPKPQPSPEQISYHLPEKFSSLGEVVQECHFRSMRELAEKPQLDFNIPAQSTSPVPATTAPDPQTVPAVYKEKPIKILQNLHAALIVGWRDSGKSAFGWKGVEHYHDLGRSCYVYSIPLDKKHLVPAWVGHIARLEDLPNGAVLLIDEAHLTCFYREPGSEAAKMFAAFINLSRQKNQVIIIVSQLTSQVHINLVRMVDVVFIKDPGVLSIEREEFKEPMEGAKKAFSGLKEADKKTHVFAFNCRTGESGFFETTIPFFWTPAISHLFDGVNIAQGVASTPTQLAQKPSREEVAQKVKEYSLANSDVGVRRLAQRFDLSVGTVYNILHGYPYKGKKSVSTSRSIGRN